jgi:hypothetical protein
VAPDAALAIDRKDRDVIALADEFLEERQTGRVLDRRRDDVAAFRPGAESAGMARWLASVALAVKVISAGLAPIRLATLPRACPIACFAAMPAPWALDGLA